MQIAANVMQKIGGKHVGGFDFCVQHFKNEGNKAVGEKISLIDINTGRYTEVVQTQMIQRKFGFYNENKFWLMRDLYIKKTASFARQNAMFWWTSKQPHNSKAALERNGLLRSDAPLMHL